MRSSICAQSWASVPPCAGVDAEDGGAAIIFPAQRQVELALFQFLFQGLCLGRQFGQQVGVFGRQRLQFLRFLDAAGNGVPRVDDLAQAAQFLHFLLGSSAGRSKNQRPGSLPLARGRASLCSRCQSRPRMASTRSTRVLRRNSSSVIPLSPRLKSVTTKTQRHEGTQRDLGARRSCVPSCLCVFVVGFLLFSHESRHKRDRIKKRKVVQFFASAHKPHRHAQLTLDIEHGATLAGAVQLGQHQAGDPGTLLEGLGLGDGVLARWRHPAPTVSRVAPGAPVCRRPP